jgi:hypothetical protein
MADLAKTSRLSVLIDTLLVLVVAYKSPVSWDRLEIVWDEPDFWIRMETIFVGLGVLSFAFVCQHSAFIIAGSLDNPTITRWSRVTKSALMLCVCLATLCGVSGYLGFLKNTKGNILNNMQTDDRMSNVARSFLGTTMLFVYPMESFVARHVCVVLLFEGRRAHEGEDASILARRDRRIGLTVALYVIAVVPAILFEDLGAVLAATGAVGGSCLSYIGPGAIYMGIHGDQLIQLIHQGTWWRRYVKNDPGGIHTNKQRKAETTTQRNPTETTALLETGAPSMDKTEAPSQEDDPEDEDVSCFLRFLQALSWYLLGMPLWCWIARFGEEALVKHHEEMALKSPHPMRIGNVAPDTPVMTPVLSRGASGSEENLKDMSLTRTDSWKEGGGEIGGRLSLKPELSSSLRPYQPPPKNKKNAQGGLGTPTSLNQQIGAKLLADKKRKQQQQGAEKDPQKAPPTVTDFLIAVFFMIFGVVALFAGLVCIAVKAS